MSSNEDSTISVRFKGHQLDELDAVLDAIAAEIAEALPHASRKVTRSEAVRYLVAEGCRRRRGRACRPVSVDRDDFCTVCGWPVDDGSCTCGAEGAIDG